MSPIYEGITLHNGGFPRVSGDEPGLCIIICTCDAFSPRERG